MNESVFIVMVQEYDETQIVGVYTTLAEAKDYTEDGTRIEQWTIGPDGQMLSDHHHLGRCHLNHRHDGDSCDYEFEWTAQ